MIRGCRGEGKVYFGTHCNRPSEGHRLGQALPLDPLASHRPLHQRSLLEIIQRSFQVDDVVVIVLQDVRVSTEDVCQAPDQRPLLLVASLEGLREERMPFV